MAAQTLEQGRYLGGRPSYGCRLADAGPNPDKARAAWGRRAHRLEPDPVTAPVVSWMFSQRLAGHSAARITRALNGAGVPWPSAADPGRNPHRTGSGWTLRTVAAILANLRYTGRQMWNRQPSTAVLVDPANTGLGHQQVQRSNLPEGWVISRRPAHAALVSEAGFITAQPGWAGGAPVPAGRADRLRAVRAAAGIMLVLRQPRLPVPRHGNSAAVPDPARPKNTYVREDQVLPHLAALAILLAGDAGQDAGNRAVAQLTGPACTAAMIDRLRAAGTVLTYGPDEKTVRAGDRDVPAVVIAEDRQHRASERRTA
ncbi:MAG: recombinase family protein [Streptosporangiaceae bacterium]